MADGKKGATSVAMTWMQGNCNNDSVKPWYLPSVCSHNSVDMADDQKGTPER